ncbi:hypothetical protein COCMIDRAFT_33703 [Bipolaris oryzae ATCC 44560]|uniref:Uncharacterized protein n=1 Tax=Bipolaris oryzae ATCC 44560 TaxID=930090 RepID=W6ZAQ9_COCMI|nr:uncharacterized protein COCMIDRAFT_33703 [Bipolaris oryzae ATCC 44560]EUC48837.1 hypothetical protein COCMIDRAFT_33703 [Bipolaris oryzae ATCC 44560]
MPLGNNTAPANNIIRLAHTLGFIDYPKEKTAEPYLSYILKQRTDNHSEANYVNLFVEVVKRFQATAPVATVQSVIDNLVLTNFPGLSANTAVGDDRRKEDVEDTVMCILGTWATMLSSFQNKRQHREVVAAYSMSSYAILDDLGVQESLSISAKRLNAFTLNVFSGVDVQWTPNVSRHLLLTNVGGRHVLELFSLPCAFCSITSLAVGIPRELQQEISESYAMLFNAWCIKPLHVNLGEVFGIRKMCWCRSCCAYRYRKRCIHACRSHGPATSRHNAANPTQSDFDPTLENLMMKDSTDSWTPVSFPYLWPRIARLEKHLQSSRPWSLWVLFRDRRDTLQFWTFLFGTVILFLTVIQVLLGIAQVVGSFQ